MKTVSRVDAPDGFRYKVILYAASTDTDFTAKLVDVHPNGVINVGEGVIRARFRESLENPASIEPGRAYGCEIFVGSTVYLFKMGHRIGVEISSSNVPMFDRNTNRQWEAVVHDNADRLVRCYPDGPPRQPMSIAHRAADRSTMTKNRA